MLTWQRFFRENNEIHQAIAIEIASRRIMNNETQFPPDSLIMRAFQYCEPPEIKVIIVAQDPYINRGEANGLAFSVDGTKLPPTLKNIYKELNYDLDIPIPEHGDLTAWAKQGILLLNSCLTVAEGKSGSHQNVGWNLLTDKVIEMLAKEGNKVFILWGNTAQEKESLIDKEKNLILKSAHPSPNSARQGFFNSKPFSKTNEYLVSKGLNPIDWRIL